MKNRKIQYNSIVAAAIMLKKKKKTNNQRVQTRHPESFGKRKMSAQC